MSIVKSFLGRLIGSGKEQPKKLLSGTDGNLFHTLILAYVRIYLQNQDAKTKDRKLSSSKHNNDEKSNSNDQKNDNNNNNNSNEEQDPTAVLLSILTIMPKISHEKLEDNCIASDLLQFLKIICHQFTNNILTIDDQERIAFYEPHLQTPDSLPTPTRNNKHKGKNKKNKSNKSYGPTDEMAQYSNPNIGKNKKNKSNKRISFLTKRTDNNNKNMPYINEGNYNDNNNKDNNIHPSLMEVYANDPKRNILADEHYLDGEYKIIKKDNDTLPSPALKRGRIVHHLTAHPSKAPFGALLSAFEQLLESSNKYIIKSRIDVLNQYGCMSSCICKLLHILSPKEWDENETPQFKDVILKLKQRLLKFFLQLSPYISTTLELVRSRQLQQIFSSLISFETTKKNKNNDNTKNIQISHEYNYLHERHHIQILLNVLSAQNKCIKNLNDDNGIYLASVVTVLTVLRSLLKYSSIVTPLLVNDFKQGNGFEVLEQLLVIASSLGDNNHETIVVENWKKTEEFGLIRPPSLLQCKLELNDMVHELVFMDDSDNINNTSNNNNNNKNNMNFSTTKRLKYFYYYIETECNSTIQSHSNHSTNNI